MEKFSDLFDDDGKITEEDEETWDEFLEFKYNFENTDIDHKTAEEFLDMYDDEGYLREDAANNWRQLLNLIIVTTYLLMRTMATLVYMQGHILTEVQGVQ